MTKVASVEQELQSCDALLVELKHHPTRAQEKMKAKADGKCRDVQFAVWDMVYLKLQPYRQKSLTIRQNEKLALVIMDLMRLWLGLVLWLISCSFLIRLRCIQYSMSRSFAELVA